MKSIAILGASNDPTKFGNKAVRGFVQKGWTVFPINPNAATIEGLPAYRSVKELPRRPNLVSAYLPAAIMVKVLPEVAQVGCDELWLNPGADDPEVVDLAERLRLNVIQACTLVGHGLSAHDT
ncbi:MAG: CoA-binding protein [Verrucomicrobiales bacterium]|nr:CoA-binding protein [Verrucomicrobiales bacterium]